MDGGIKLESLDGMLLLMAENSCRQLEDHVDKGISQYVGGTRKGVLHVGVHQLLSDVVEEVPATVGEGAL